MDITFFTKHRVLNYGIDSKMLPHYLICNCGAWNTRDAWHIAAFTDHCYMCKTPLFRLPKELQQSLILASLNGHNVSF